MDLLAQAVDGQVTLGVADSTGDLALGRLILDQGRQHLQNRAVPVLTLHGRPGVELTAAGQRKAGQERPAKKIGGLPQRGNVSRGFPVAPELPKEMGIRLHELAVQADLILPGDQRLW